MDVGCEHPPAPDEHPGQDDSRITLPQQKVSLLNAVLQIAGPFLEM